MGLKIVQASLVLVYQLLCRTYTNFCLILFLYESRELVSKKTAEARWVVLKGGLGPGVGRCV